MISSNAFWGHLEHGHRQQDQALDHPLPVGAGTAVTGRKPMASGYQFASVHEHKKRFKNFFVFFRQTTRKRAFVHEHILLQSSILQKGLFVNLFLQGPSDFGYKHNFQPAGLVKRQTAPKAGKGKAAVLKENRLCPQAEARGTVLSCRLRQLLRGCRREGFLNIPVHLFF